MEDVWNVNEKKQRKMECSLLLHFAKSNMDHVNLVHIMHIHFKAAQGESVAEWQILMLRMHTGP